MVLEMTGSYRETVAMSEPQPRPVESSASVDQSPREQGDDADVGDPESDRRRPRESVVEESDEWEETEEEWVRIHRRPRRVLFSSHDSHGAWWAQIE